MPPLQITGNHNIAIGHNAVSSNNIIYTKEKNKIIIGNNECDINNIIIGGYNINELLENNRRFKIQSAFLEILSKEVDELKADMLEIKQELNERRKNK